MANDQSGGIGLGGVVKAFGGSRAAPKPKYFSLTRPVLGALSMLGRNTIRGLGPGLSDFANTFNQGTQRQLGLQGEQEDVLRGLLNRRLASDPQDQLRQTLSTLFAQIDPNILNPLANADVNANILMRRARGLNPAAVHSTAEDLRNAAIRNGRYYDVARQVFGTVPNLYNQIRNAGVTDEQLAAGFIPQIQQGYRQLDYAPLVPLQAGLDLTGQAADLTGRIADDERRSIYGYRQPSNLADRFGSASQAISNTLQQAADIYSSLYGGGALGGGGGTGGIAGMFGGGNRTIPNTGSGVNPNPTGYPYFQQQPIFNGPYA